eukprot:c2602_g1_i1.p1 GENE.c2602_g1_i1~~c2602_g1_i1.p1  ORF type:complete len:1704 (-),score=279.63 c2602_g1_i1:25-5001(-)
MVGAIPRPGTEAQHPRTGQQMDVISCDDGQVGGEFVTGEFWPSPVVSPSAAPIPPPQEVLEGRDPSPSPAPEPGLVAHGCEDDDGFFDSQHLNCRDYTMNKVLCGLAERFANPDGRTAQHACCKCGGGKQVLPKIGRRCVRSASMIGDDCIEQDKYTTLRNVQGDQMLQPVSAGDHLPATDNQAETPANMGESSGSPEVVAEDMVEDEAADKMTTIESADSSLEPDSVVFRDRNFIGQPSEPDAEEQNPDGGFVSTYFPQSQFKKTKYIVQPRDTFDSIAEKYRIPGSVLIGFNEQVADPLLIRPGDEIFIPGRRLVGVTGISPNQSSLEGGVDVLVTGLGFVFPAFCKFGNLITAATYVVDDVVVCPAPGQKDPGVYPFSVSNGRGGFDNTKFSFDYTVEVIPFCEESETDTSHCRPRISIFTVSPLKIAEDTPAEISVVGTGFNASTVCKIGGEVVASTIVSRTNIVCHFQGKPPSQNAITLEQGSLTVPTKFSIVVFSTLTITKLEPTFGPDSANTKVTIFGTSFKAGALCHFGETAVPATVVSQTQLTCTTPIHPAGIADVGVSLGQRVAEKKLQFEFTHIRLLKLSQTSGSYRGGDLVFLSGTGFYPIMFCRFGSETFRAQFATFEEARCTVPPQLLSKVVSVKVSLDGITFSDEIHEYHYFADITEIRPTEGRAIGGDDVHVFGSGFDPDCSYLCVFGSVSVPGIVITTSQIQCTTPPGTDVVDFALESKDTEYRKNSDGKLMTFTYVSANEVDLFAAFPSFTDVEVPGTSVLLSGSGFVPGTLCRFGDEITPSHFVSEHSIKCDAPMRYHAEIVPISVSHDAGRTWSGQLTRFEYRAIVQDVVPSIGPLEGGNVIVITGIGFSPRVSLCLFGNTFVTAIFRSSNELACIVPASDVAARVPFAVTTNPKPFGDPYLEFKFAHPDATKQAAFYIYSRNPGFVVQSIDPATGSIFGGNLAVVHGQGFDHSSHCMFGERTVKAVFLGESTINCVVPPHSPGDVIMQVVNLNRKLGYNISANAVSYTFVAPTINQIEPSEGFVMGGESVRITGTFLTAAITCKFGQNSSPVTRVTSTEVVCSTPPSAAYAIVNVELGFGSAGSSNSGTLFTYHPAITSVAPQSGFILTDSQSVTFHGKGFAGEPILCSFDNSQIIPATIVSDSELECPVPASALPHTSQLKLTNAARNVVLGKQVFEFKYQPRIHAIFPSLGPTTGGTTVVVVGSGFSAITHCKFGSDRVNALVISDLMVRCKSPTRGAGTIKLTLIAETGNKLTNLNTDNADFTFRVITTRVENVEPVSGSIGGGTLVTIHGSGFSMGSLCKFGDLVTTATFFSQTHVECFSPQVEKSQTVTLEVSQTASGPFSQDNNTFTFGDKIATVQRIDPALGVKGTQIHIFGESFDESSICFIGGRRGTSTTFVSANHLVCEIPQMGSKIVEIVQVAPDPTVLPGGHVYFHYNVPLSDSTTVAVREIVPDHGPASGATNVTVFGINFPNSAVCRFGDLISTAVVVSPNEINCLSPAHKAGVVALEIVSRNRLLFSSSLIRYTFEGSNAPDEDELFKSVTAGVPEVTQISPRFGRPGQTITLVGQKFSSVGYCVFYSANANVLSDATVVDSSHVTCKVPDPVGDLTTDTLLKYLSIGGAESKNLAFKYLVS